VSSLSARVADLANRLHMPGYPAEMAPVVVRLAEDVALAEAEAASARASSLAALAERDARIEALTADLAAMTARAGAAEACALRAQQKVLGDVLRAVDDMIAMHSRGRQIGTLSVVREKLASMR
jgi:hypothetical protein